jgi:hypothetical protein
MLTTRTETQQLYTKPHVDFTTVMETYYRGSLCNIAGFASSFCCVLARSGNVAGWLLFQETTNVLVEA